MTDQQHQTTAHTVTNPCSSGAEVENPSLRDMSSITPEAIAPSAVHIIELPWRKPPLSMNDRAASRGAVFAKASKTRNICDGMVYLARKHRLPTNQPYCRVQLHYLPADNRRRDTDNLVATLKPICDGLAQGYGLVKDDIPQLMGKPEPIIHTHRKGQQPRMWLEISIYPRSNYPY